jgi:hypothetical protein
MYNPTKYMIDGFVENLQAGYRRNYGGLKPDYADIIGWAANMALENIANSDALYHNVEHTIYVTLVGQEILWGKHIREGGVSCEDWLHCIISLLCHDIGFVKGVCRKDRPSERKYAKGIDHLMITLPFGCTDASLNNYHVDRGKMFIQERFGSHKIIDANTIKKNIELTRFPVPNDNDHQDTTEYPGLVRAGDLIGQLSDPRYLQKISALFYEFEETETNTTLGYKNPGDLRKNYSNFYWKVVHRYIQPALEYLDVTLEGKQILANLYANVFRVEHDNIETRELFNSQNVSN